MFRFDGVEKAGHRKDVVPLLVHRIVERESVVVKASIEHKFILVLQRVHGNGHAGLICNVQLQILLGDQLLRNRFWG